MATTRRHQGFGSLRAVCVAGCIHGKTVALPCLSACPELPLRRACNVKMAPQEGFEPSSSGLESEMFAVYTTEVLLGRDGRTRTDLVPGNLSTAYQAEGIHPNNKNRLTAIMRRA